nr:reverse transcriptase domain-containing protein [Tanacetum cinerariifolium]
MLSEFFQNQASTFGTLPSNTIPNPKGEMKAITTRSGVAYEGPSIPTPKKVVERETEETTDKEQTNFQRSTTHIQPSVTPILEPDVPKTLPKPNIPYPLRHNDQKLREKATNQMEKFFQIFQDLHFNISFADALILMLKFSSTIKSSLRNKDTLFELAKIPLNENCSAMLLKKLGDPGKFLIPCDFPRMDMILELADRFITRPEGVAKDVFVKMGKFHFSADFVIVDFEADPRVPLILGRSFLRTGRVLIDIYGEEITLRVNDEVVTFNLNQTTRYSSTYDVLSVNRIDIIDVAREDDFILEEIEAYLKDESILLEIDHADCDPEGDICLIEKLLNNDPFQLPPMDLKKLSSAKNGLEFDRAKVYVIAKPPHPTTVKGVRSFLGHAGFYRRFIQDFSKIARPMTHLLEKETPFVFSKDCIDAFETLKKKLTEAPILVVPDWNLPFELMCGASDFAIEFDIIIRDKKWTENLAADHLSSLENPHKDVFKNKDINENFPLETLGKIYSGSTPWTLNITSGTIPTVFGYVRIKSFDDVCMAKKLMISSKLVMKDPPGAIMVPISPPRKYILVAVDYLSKWVEAKALPTYDARAVVKFLKSLFARFGTPRAIISDRGTHFVMINLLKTVGENRASWSEKLDDTLWAFKTAYKTPIGFTPYKTFYHHQSFPYGTVELSQPDGPNFKVNDHRAKHYFGGDVP